MLRYVMRLRLEKYVTLRLIRYVLFVMLRYVMLRYVICRTYGCYVSSTVARCDTDFEIRICPKLSVSALCLYANMHYIWASVG